MNGYNMRHMIFLKDFIIRLIGIIDRNLEIFRHRLFMFALWLYLQTPSFFYDANEHYASLRICED